MDKIGGYIFIPQELNIPQSKLIKVCINTLGDLENIIKVTWQEEESISPLPVKDALNQLYQQGNGEIEMWMNGLLGWLGFKKNGEIYQIVKIEVAISSFLDPQEPESIEAFKSNWVSLCEACKCEFGYFGDYPLQLEAKYLEEEVITPLLGYEIDDLIRKAYWLTYLGSSIASSIESLDSYPFHRLVQKIQSGAIVFHAGRGENPISGELC